MKNIDVTIKRVKIKNETKIVISATVVGYLIGRDGRNYQVKIGDDFYYINQDDLESASKKINRDGTTDKVG